MTGPDWIDAGVKRKITLIAVMTLALVKSE
jgi:hypothetical protein